MGGAATGGGERLSAARGLTAEEETDRVHPQVKRYIGRFLLIIREGSLHARDPGIADV